MSASIAPETWTSDERALALFGMRESLLQRLPAQMPAAAALDPYRREEIVDEVITLTAYDSPHPVSAHDELEGLAWGTLRFKVLQAHEGRYDTVRGAYQRVDETELASIAGDRDDPVAYTEGREQTRLVLEFIRRLEPLERDVFTVRHTADGRRSGRVGYARIAAELRQPEKVVRAALRKVEYKLAAYQKLVADPSAFTDRALIALPAVVATDRAARPAGWREALIDWLLRPFGHDSAAVASTIAGSGGGRGLGSVAVALCLGGSAAGGGYCLVTGDVPLLDRTPTNSSPGTSSRSRPAISTANATQGLRGLEDQFAAASAAATTRAARRRADQRQQARRARRRTRAAAERREIARNSRRSETAQAVTPAAPNAATDGSSEFDPTFQPSVPEQPAAPADPGGLPEFP